MGNKSKQNGKKQTQKWAQRRNIAAAVRSGWGGLAPKSPSGAKTLPVLWPSATRGTFRKSQVWS